MTNQRPNGGGPPGNDVGQPVEPKEPPAGSEEGRFSRAPAEGARDIPDAPGADSAEDET